MRELSVYSGYEGEPSLKQRWHYNDEGGRDMRGRTQSQLDRRRKPKEQPNGMKGGHASFVDAEIEAGLEFARSVLTRREEIRRKHGVFDIDDLMRRVREQAD
jgi:hypothetical protein